MPRFRKPADPYRTFGKTSPDQLTADLLSHFCTAADPKPSENALPSVGMFTKRNKTRRLSAPLFSQRRPKREDNQFRTERSRQ